MSSDAHRSHAIPLYHFNIFHSVVTQKRSFKHEKWWIHQCRHLATFAASPRLLRCHATYVDGKKCENSSFWKIVLLFHPHSDVSYSLVVTYPEFGWKIVCAWWQKYCVCISSPSLAIAGEPGKRHVMRRKLFLIGWIHSLWGPCQPPVTLRISPEIQFV